MTISVKQIRGLTAALLTVAVLAQAGPAHAVVSAAGRMTAGTDNKNGNWAGYLAEGKILQANATLVQPKITCSKGESSSAGFWTGVSDKDTTTVAQDGTAAFCYHGKAAYYLWWEALGRPDSQGGEEPVPVLAARAAASCVKFTGTTTASLKQLAALEARGCLAAVRAGDTINLSVDVEPRAWANFFAYDYQTRVQLNTTQTFKNATSGAAEWVAETQFLGSGLSDFKKVTFKHCYAYTASSDRAIAIGQLSNTRLDLIDYQTRKPVATPGSLTKPSRFGNGKQDGFDVTWNRHGEGAR
jgi:peptidase A4-like protein